WERGVTRFAHGAEQRFDRWRARFSSDPGTEDPIKIVAYRGYGTADKMYLKGRVQEDEGIPPASEEDSLWRNMINVYKRFESDEVAGARVLARFQGQEHEIVTDEEGYFDLWIAPAAPLPTDRLWHEIELELSSPQREGHPSTHSTGYVLVPPPSARFGIISDVDDTVVLTNATSVLKMARTVFLGNAHTRVPFAGVAAFYEALQAGITGHEFNPLFYVSSSPWNLYDLLVEFLEIQDIPLGPAMLRDWGISNDEVLPTKHAPHKRKSIFKILDTFPDLSFILIGDSGQEDPEIYHDVVHQYPERILAIYIRNLGRDPMRAEAINALAEEVTKAGSTLVLTDDTLAAALHAAQQEWISQEALPDIRAQVAVDTSDTDADTDAQAPTIVIEGKR
ncbi:MAG: App1 family protein, partial [Ardenticatenaceae bacterium]